jgi:hypothetical protein
LQKYKGQEVSKSEKMQLPTFLGGCDAYLKNFALLLMNRGNHRESVSDGWNANGGHRINFAWQEMAAMAYLLHHLGLPLQLVAASWE